MTKNSASLKRVTPIQKQPNRTIRLPANAHTLASQLSQQYGISMCACVALGLVELSKLKQLPVPPRDRRSTSTSVRRALRYVVLPARAS